MKKRSVALSTVVLVLLTTLVFGAPGLSQSPPPPALERLRQDAGGEVEITWNSRTGTPSFIRGSVPLSGISVQSEDDASAAALAFVDRYADLFGVQDASQELTVVQSDVDALGMRHVTFGQVYKGVEVYSAHMKVHLSADGQEVVAASSGFMPGIALSDTQPRITAEEALANASHALPGGALVADPRLAIYTGDLLGPSAHLAWLVQLRDDAIPVRNIYVIDAVDGTILAVLDRLYKPTSFQTQDVRVAYESKSVSTAIQQSTPKCLTFPFPPDSEMNIQQGWTSSWDPDHHGIDYIKGRLDDSDTWQSFPILAAADGEACGQLDGSSGDCVAGPGNRVLIKHVVDDQTFYSYYGHLSTIDDQIPLGSRSDTVHVQRGQVIGYAGDTGSTSGWVHLHFGFASSSFEWVDPYDLRSTRKNYPDPNSTNGKTPGPNHYWTSLRETYDADHGYSLPGTLARSEGDGPIGDQDVDNAHGFAGDTYDYYWNTHGRNSYDAQGATFVSTANYGDSYTNAFWNGEQTVYGDDFAVNDVVAHEWTHAVTEHSAALEYRWQSGALNESFSDIFGAMVDRDDWLIGEDLPDSVLGGREAIRDMADPAHFGQPAHTDDWVETCSDNEGVHTNSGIPNKAYYNIANAIGKDKAEHIFYRALTVYLDTNSSLEDARAAALQSATDLYGDGSAEYNGVRDGFDAVGLDGVWEPEPNDCTCAASTALSDETVYSDPLSVLEVATTLYRVRDQLLAGEAGEHYRALYEQHTGRISYLLLEDATLRAAGGEILKQLTPGLGRLMDGAGDEDIVTQETVDGVVAFLHQLAEEDRTNGGGDLADTIEQEMARIEWDHMVGMTYTEAWEYIQSRITVHFLYLPLVVK